MQIFGRFAVGAAVGAGVGTLVVGAVDAVHLIYNVATSPDNPSIQDDTESVVRTAHPYIPSDVMDEIIEREYHKIISDPYAAPHGYFGDPATQAMLDMLDSRFALVQGNPLAIEIMARRQLEAMDFLNGLDRAAAEANSHSSGGGGGSGRSSGERRDGGSSSGGAGSSGRVTSAGDLSSDAGITTGDFDPPGTWSDGGDHGTPDPGLPVNPDYTGIQPVIFDLDGDGVEVNASARVNFDWDGDGFQESGNGAACNPNAKPGLLRVAS